MECYSTVHADGCLCVCCLFMFCAVFGGGPFMTIGQGKSSRCVRGPKCSPEEVPLLQGISL